MRTRLTDPVYRHRMLQLAVDALLVAAAYFLAYLLRFDNGIPQRYQDLLRDTILFVVVGKVAIFAAFGLYNKWWRYVGLRDLESILRAVVVASLALVGVLYVWSPTDHDLPRSIAVMDLLLTAALVGGARLVVRSALERPSRGAVLPKGQEILIVGAGEAGQLVCKEMQRAPELRQTPIGFVDDDPRKRGMRMLGLKVLGTNDDLELLLDEVEPDEVIIAIPSAPGVVREKVVRACRDRDIPVRTLPGVFELISGSVDLIRQVREVQVEDILGREPVQLDPAAVGAYVRGRTVLVTGAGGSIGSELCRQLVRMEVGRLVLADHAENNLFQIDRELRESTRAEIVPAIADVRDAARMEAIFEAHRPAVVFHAAAYKHVPLMEQHPVQALRNNALATRTVARLAARHAVDRFVLVSTDKAVYPKTAMGASKALAEWVVEALGQIENETTFVAVRFGNVLGSSGSVVPIFREQIARGGPVTVTDPEMTRYFMTIHEAAQLIVQAGGVGRGGDVFVLDMGDPVRILDLANDMIRLSGLEPERDIPITFTGIRPGEKLHEGLFEDSEEVERTHHDKLMRARRSPISPEWLESELDAVERFVNEGDEPAALERVRAMIANPRRADSEQPAVAAPA